MSRDQTPLMNLDMITQLVSAVEPLAAAVKIAFELARPIPPHVTAQLLRTAKSAIAFRAAVAVVADSEGSSSIRHWDGGRRGSRLGLISVHVMHSRHVGEEFQIDTERIAWCRSE